MPIERRCPNSGALIFVPTEHEKSVLSQKKELKKALAEVDDLKEELKSLIKQMKSSK